MAEMHKEERVDKEESTKEEITLKEKSTEYSINGIIGLLIEIRDLLKESLEKEKEADKKKKERAERREERKFKPPTLDDITDFCNNNNFIIDPQAFFAYYESNGWKVGRNKMKSWKATCINWNARAKDAEAKNAKATKNFFDELANIHEDDPMDWGTV